MAGGLLCSLLLADLIIIASHYLAYSRAAAAHEHMSRTCAIQASQCYIRADGAMLNSIVKIPCRRSTAGNTVYYLHYRDNVIGRFIHRWASLYIPQYQKRTSIDG